MLAASCNLVVDASADSCESDADCVNLPSTKCDTEQGVCVSVDLCAANADCPDDQICRRFSPRACVSLTTPTPAAPGDPTSEEPNCHTLYPDDPAVWRDDNTILIGVTSPRSFVLEGGEVVDSVDTITNGAILAVDEINDKGGVDNQSKLALVICDDYGNDNFAENNGRALAAMGVQSILGAAFSSQTIDMATGTDGQAGTVAAGIVSISSGATSPDVTGIEDHAPACVADCGADDACASACPGLVWRTAPSDKIQGDAINTYFKDLEPIVKDRSGTTQTTIKVTVLHADDSYGKNLSEFVKTGLEFNGKKANLQPTEFHVRDYGAGTPDPAVLDGAIADAADVYILLPTYDELGGTFIPNLEAAWTGLPETRPFYVMADGALNESMIADVLAADAMSRARGTIPGTKNDRFTNFRFAYEERFPDAATQGTPDTFGAAGAYDVIYLLTYSALAAKSAPLTGEQLARGLAMTADVAGGAAIEAGPTAFGDASNDLRNGIAINYEGASGPLDFDLQTGEAPSDIQVWCVDATGATPYSGRYFDPASGTTKGTADAGTGACPF